jgi:hypothetical protein
MSFLGGRWYPVTVPLPAGAAASPDAKVEAVSCASTRQCAAVGTYTDTAGHTQGMILTWSAGKRWTAVRAPLPRGTQADPAVTLAAISCPTASRCTAIGGYISSTGTTKGLLLTWSGHGWKSAVGLPDMAGAMALSCPSATACYAANGGEFMIGP